MNMQSIVLRRRDLKEVDQIITLYTRERGKIDALARGIKKIASKNTAHLEPCMFVDAEIIPGKDIDLVIKAVPIELFKSIRTTMQKSFFAQYAVAIIDRTTETGQRDVQIFDLLHDWLMFLNATPTVHAALVDALILRLLSFYGMQPELERCVSCGSTDHLTAIAIASGGVLCDRCYGIKKQMNEIALFACPDSVREQLIVLLYSSWEKAAATPAEQYQSLHAMIYAFVQFQTPKAVRDWATLPA